MYKKLTILIICSLLLSACDSSLPETVEPPVVESTVESSFVDEAGVFEEDVVFDQNYDGISEKLIEIGFTEQEASELREIFLACGITSLDGMELPSGDVTIDGLLPIRILENGEPVWFFTIDARSLLYISYYGTDVYDRDNGGILINVGDIHIPETDMTESEKYGLRDLSETVLDDYFKYTPYYDAWGVAREDDMYMVQCEAYAKNGLGIKDWVPVKVWYQKVDGEYEVVAVQIDGVRYDPTELVG